MHYLSHRFIASVGGLAPMGKAQLRLNWPSAATGLGQLKSHTVNLSSVAESCINKHSHEKYFHVLTNNVIFEQGPEYPLQERYMSIQFLLLQSKNHVEA